MTYRLIMPAKSLICLDQPIAEMMADIKHHVPWDYDGDEPLAIVTRKDVISILERLYVGRLTLKKCKNGLT